ncbi:uncharacterized protein [Diadema antillarum]|uniref:uncharacterized protein n=1 Tax=Diadema antillarum TaxID=105358 RepID=UPI003A87F215
MELGEPANNPDSGKASVINLERQLKDLKERNETLEKELENVKSMYEQLVAEGPAEQYSERRVHLLKAQVIQLERQVLMQAEGLSSRSRVLFEVENNLQSIADDLRELLSSEVKGPSVPVQRSQLTTMIETAESARLRLYKNLESTNQENMELPLIFTGGFAKHKPHPYDCRPVSIMDVCSGKIDHLNLKHVAKLESKLFSLHHQLALLSESLKISLPRNDAEARSVANPYAHLPSASGERMMGLLVKVDRLLAECCQDLSSLSILVPAAPWPLLTKSIAPEVSVDSVLAALPSFPRNKQQQVKSVIEAAIKASNYSRRVSKMEAKACAEELKFHQALYDLQFKYIQSLYDAVRESYMMFESSIQDTICTPMKDVMTHFERLRETASEDALRQFLSSFKSHRQQVNAATEGLSRSKGSGADAISKHGEQFLEAVRVVGQRTAAERDRLAAELDEVKRMRDEHLKEGLDVFRQHEKKEEEEEGDRGEKVEKEKEVQGEREKKT